MEVLRYFFIGIILASCSPKQSVINSKLEDSYVLFPKESDTARIQFLTSFNGSFDVIQRKSKFEESITGEQINKTILKPYGFNIRNNKLIICDVSLKGLEIIDLNEKSFDYFVPPGASSFRLPINCKQDNDGNLYVVDPDKKVVQIYNEKLSLINSIQFEEDSKPISVGFDENSIFVVDLTQFRVNIYNKTTLEYVDYFPKSVQGNDDWLAAPTNIAIFKNKIYVTDLGQSNVKVFLKDGTYLNTIGSLGQQLGQFVRPKGIDLDNDENLYVVDGAFNNVQIFNKEGQLLMFFGGTDNERGNMYLPTQLQVDYTSVDFFKKYVHPDYELEYLIIVANQYGKNKISVYGKIKLKK